MGLWGHENTQDPIYARSRTGFAETLTNFLLLWVSKLQTYIALYALDFVYVALSHSVRELLHLKSFIKELIKNSGFDSNNLKFVSSSTIYEYNN